MEELKFADIGFRVVVELESHYCTFAIYYYNDGTTQIEYDELLFTGCVKWDGCSDWQIPEDRGCLHFCGKDDLVNFNILLNRLYDFAKYNIENWMD